MANANQAQSATEDIPWNDRVSTGIIRVGMFSSFACRFWRDFFKDCAHGQIDWWNVLFALVTTFFIFTSAGWAIHKWLERRR